MRGLIRAIVGCAAVAVVALAGAPAAGAAPSGPAAKAGGTGDGKAAATILVTPTLAPGVSYSKSWIHIPAGNVYDVGLSPQGASTTAPCAFQVTRQWYTQVSAGTRTFYWTVKNVGTIACSTQMLLTARPTTASLGSYALDPGSSISKEWNIDLAKPVYIAGASPSGATSSSNCSMEITRSWFGRTSAGSIHMFVVLKNVGSIACSSTIQFSSLARTSTVQTSSIAAGSTYSTVWNNINPLDTARWSAMSPSSTVNCKLELTKKVYAQRVWADGSGTKRELQFSVKNVGGVSCSGQILLASVAA